MANITTNEHYQQVLSMALEERLPGFQDLVSDNNALLATLKRKGLQQTFSGPRIREMLQIDKQDVQWYSGYDILNNPPIDLFNSAYFTPKQVAVPISLSGEEIVNNEGPNQVRDVLRSYMEAAERAAMDGMDAALHSDGTGDGGKQLGGLALAVPIVTDTGTYGGLDRSTVSIWRTTTYDANSMISGITQVDKTTIRQILNTIMTARSRGSNYADLLLMSPEHFSAYDLATTEIQRIQKEGGLAKLGFSALAYVGGGKQAEIVQDGGFGSNMPANTTYGLNTSSLRLRYHPSRNWSKLFDGDGQKPINQDAIAQFLVWMGELTMTNPLFTWRLYDSVPAS